ncbi:MAG: hypothetical protein IJ480_00425 [Clostridia bacterium]|nr:hypothetical protein [Clostridia bacterium]
MRCYATETMTCVSRYTGTVMKLNEHSFHYAVYRDGLSDDLYVTVGWADPERTEDITACLELNLAETRMSFGTLEGWDDPVCRISCSAADGKVYLEKKWEPDVMTNGALVTDGVWIRFDQYTVLPEITLEAVLYANHTGTLTWSLHPGDDRNGWGTAMELRQREPGETEYRTTVLFADELRSSCRLTTGQDLLGMEACLMLEYRTFAADWDGETLEDFVTLNRVLTPLQTVERDAAIPLAPDGIETTLLLDGGKVTVSWPVPQDPVNTIVSCILERASAAEDSPASDFIRLYEGSSGQFRDTLPEGLDTVRYRVCSVNAAGTRSPWTDSGTLQIVKSNVYTAIGGRWIRAAAVWIGGKKASPMVKVR